MKIKLLKYLASVPLLMLISSPVYAASNPALGAANSYGILSSSYANTASGTTINGDLGYTTGPQVTPTVNGNTYVASGTYSQAGTDQNAALSALNSQPCDVNFGSSTIDLATDTTHGTLGVYTPGVYCSTGAVSVGTGGITLTGGGTYIFRMTGALTTAANSAVTLAGGASACTIWWTPTAATTLGANSTFLGTDIDPAGITIESTVTWTGRALAFGGTVSSTTDTLNTVPMCSAASTPTSSTTNSGTDASAAVGNASNTTGTSLTNTGLSLAPISVLAAMLLAVSCFIRFRKPAGKL